MAAEGENLKKYSDIFASLKHPFILYSSEAHGSNFESGTMFRPFEEYIEAVVKGAGAEDRKYLISCPSVQDVSSGFDAVSLAGELNQLKAVMAPFIPGFDEMTHVYAESGSIMKTSCNVSIASCGQKSEGYFDLVVTARSSESRTRGDFCDHYVNYDKRSSQAYMKHSGDKSNLGNLVHTVDFLSGDNDSHGLVVLVGYNQMHLRKWFGKTAGLFIVDHNSRISTFVPMDLSNTTVRDNTSIVPLLFRRSREAMTFKVMDTMETGGGDTQDCYKDDACPANSLLNSRFEEHFPTEEEVSAYFANTADSSLGQVDTANGGDAGFHSGATVFQDIHDKEATDTSLSSELLHDGSPAQVCVTEGHASSLPGLKTFYLARSLREEPHALSASHFSVLPFLFPGESLCGRNVALYQRGLSSGDILSHLGHRRLVLHVPASLGIDGAFLKSRAAEGSNIGPARLNAVFIIHIESIAEVSKANLSLVSMYAGPRCTVVYKARAAVDGAGTTNDGGGVDGESASKYYLGWATPASVIPHAMSDSLNPEWPDFHTRLVEYLSGPVDADSIVRYDQRTAADVAVQLPACIKSKVPQESVTLAQLEAYLQACADLLTLEEKLLVVQHLYAFEYILDEKGIMSVQTLLRKHFKSNITPALRIAFFKRMQREGATHEERKTMVESAKIMERSIGLLASRSQLTVNEFFAVFQEKKALHGEKGAAKMDLGLACRDFVKGATDLSSIIDANADYIIARVNTRAVGAFISNFTSGADSALLTEEMRRERLSMAALDARTPTLDACTVDCMAALGVPHDLETRAGAQFALPTMSRHAVFRSDQPDSLQLYDAQTSPSGSEQQQQQQQQSNDSAMDVEPTDYEDDDSTYSYEEDWLDSEYAYDSTSHSSMVFLPVFDDFVPPQDDFKVVVWAYLLVHGFRESSLFPRELQGTAKAPRVVEYAVLNFLTSLMEKLCALRTSPVVTKEDSNDVLVKRIRSVYWMLRNVMLMNVAVTTPEPIMSLLSAGTANHHIEIEIAWRVVHCLPKTGLPVNMQRSAAENVHAVLLRCMFRPFEQVFKKMNVSADEKENAEAHATSAFYRDAEEVSSDVVPARVRPKICRKCNTVQTKHHFPRKKQFFYDRASEETTFACNLDKAVCYSCHGYKADAKFLRCSRRSQCKRGDGLGGGYVGPFTDFAVTSFISTCHGCILSATAANTGSTPACANKKRKIPPQYYDLIGKKVPAGKEVQVVDDGRVQVSGLYRSPGTIFFPGDLLQLCSAAGNAGTPLWQKGQCSIEQILRYGYALGMLSSTNAASEVVRQEICGIYNLMLDNYREKPAWKGILPAVMEGKHRTTELNKRFALTYADGEGETS